MTPERWQRIREVYERTASLAVAERSPYLDKICDGDLELRSEVESLLTCESRAGSGFLNTPAVALLSPEFQGGVEVSRIGRRVGVYQIIEEIGHGGMGEVFRARRADGQYEKEVAIKLVRTGYGSAFILERFRNERQILASLDHPNIARLLDGGTTDDGVPYLVMELIDGTPIDEYCEQRALSIPARLELFRQACAAVQYAHQRLVIHRDLKPSNILVLADGMPKLLDFGIAKLLDPSAPGEVTLAQAMTPDYASPEQIRGDPITTATDVYSLGVVLYKLLTGRSPYPRETRVPHELAQAICEIEPEKPSTVILKNKGVSQPATNSSLTQEPAPGARAQARLHRRLRGDLDNIALKALRKETQRRYPSVEQFSEDIWRHLNGLPVTAAPDSLAYRASKFAKRHRAGVAAAALVAVAIAVGLAATLREARIARAQAEIASAQKVRAEKRFNDVRKLANSLMFEVHDAIRDLPGSTPARSLLVTRALEYLDSLSQEAKGDFSLQRELAAAYERVGDVLGYPYTPNLGDRAGAMRSYRKALAIRELLVVADPEDTSLQQELVGNYYRIAHVLESDGNFPHALDAIHKAVLITQRLAEGTKDSVHADQLAGAYYFTGALLTETGDSAHALENYRRAASIREAALQNDRQSVPLRTHLAADYGGIAKSLEQTSDFAHAVQMQAKAVAILEEVSSANPSSAITREYLGEAISELGACRELQGDAAGALTAYRKAHQIFGRLLAADAKNMLAKTNFGSTDTGIGRSLVALGNPAAAINVFGEAVTAFEQMSPAGDRLVRTGLAEAYAGLGQAYLSLAGNDHLPVPEQRRHWEQARSSCQKSLAIWDDKAKRGELESDERDKPRQAAQCVTSSDSRLHPSGRGQ